MVKRFRKKKAPTENPTPAPTTTTSAPIYTLKPKTTKPKAPIFGGILAPKPEPPVAQRTPLPEPKPETETKEEPTIKAPVFGAEEKVADNVCPKCGKELKNASGVKIHLRKCKD